MLIDDNAMLREVLTNAGHIVMQAEGGRPAVKLFRADPADLVITDARSSVYLALAAILDAQRTRSKPFSGTMLLAGIDELLPLPKAPQAR